MRPFDATVAPGIAATGQPEHPVPPDRGAGACRREHSQRCSPWRIPAAKPPAPATPSADVIEAEGKPAASADVESGTGAAVRRPAGAARWQRRSAPRGDRGRDTAQRIEWELGAEKEIAQAPRRPATEAEPPRAVDVKADSLAGLKADVEVATGRTRAWGATPAACRASDPHRQPEHRRGGSSERVSSPS